MGTPSSVEKFILFDGVCNLCNSSVLFIIQRDPHKKFKFASLQSAFGKDQLKKHGFSESDFHSIILIAGDNIYQRSNAALEIARNLTGLWPLLYGFKIIPAFLRDAVYNLIARNRYKFFGKKDECMIPTPELRARFVD